MNPEVEHRLKYFTYTHLPAHLQEVSKPFCELAQQIAEPKEGQTASSGFETVEALRWLQLAKDAAVRAMV